MSDFVKSARTETPVGSSRTQLEKKLRRYGCSHFGSSTDYDNGMIAVWFRVNDDLDSETMIPIRVEIKVARVVEMLFGNDPTQRQREQAERVAWRQLVLWVDAACSAAAAGVQKMSEAFFAHMLIEQDGERRRLVDHFKAASGGNEWTALLAPPQEEPTP